MGKVYQDTNVLEATYKRFDFIFKEFDNIIVSFSGGKDSGLLLQLTYQYMKDNNINKRLIIYHQDNESQFQMTTDYVTETFAKYKDIADCYWFCNTMELRTAVSNYETRWWTWDQNKKDFWVRDMPTFPYVYNDMKFPERNGISFKDYYKFGREYHIHAKSFEQWVRDAYGGKTVSLVGLRADESLHRYSAIVNKVHDYKGIKWITEEVKNVWSASPIYDWTTEDVWIGHAKFKFTYNTLYDLFYKAGVSIHDMRVASPYNDDAVASLNMYRILDPKTWNKVCSRVSGCSCAVLYGNTSAMGYKSASLPKGHTWKSYCKFLLATLPEDVRKGYISKFVNSIRFWRKVGGGLSDNVVKDLESHGYKIGTNGYSPYCKKPTYRIVFKQQTPDNTDDIKSCSPADLPSYKRFCIAILKNDHLCLYLGYGLTPDQAKIVKFLNKHVSEIKK